MSVTSEPVERRLIHHIAFDVRDVSEAIKFFVDTFGMGPFYRLRNVQGNDPSNVSAGFGYWGNIYVELMPAMAGRIDSAPRFNHVAYMSSEPAEESARLAGLGLKKFMEFKVGNVWPQFHDASDKIGCAVEIHQRSAELDGFFKLVAESSQDWDGSDPERVILAPGLPQ
jgi:catechol 2,3-dioxygenase-like lactoylglutathione lyase family enzyme